MPGGICSDKYFVSLSVAHQGTWGATDYIPAWTIFLVPDASEVKVLTPAEVAKAETKHDWEEARPDEAYMKVIKAGMTCQYFLPPPSGDTPSAFFAVGLPDDPHEEPNMEFQDILLTSTTGLTIAFKPDSLMKRRDLQACAEEVDQALGFRIRVLVNCEPLRKGDLLTKPGQRAPTRERGPASAITPSTVTRDQSNRKAAKIGK